MSKEAIKYSKDGVVKFDEKYHTYVNTITGEMLEGVTSYINRYKEKFDAEAAAKKYALKHGLNKDDLLLQWKEKSDVSRNNGTTVHSMFEHFFLTGNIKVDPLVKKCDIAANFIHDYFLSKKLEFVDCELVVYNDFMASMIDCVVRNKEGNYFILDWKTNESISKNNYGKYMYKQYSYLPDASYYHYSLQTRLYQKMCKEYNIEDCFIVHIGNDNYNFHKAINIL